MSWPIGSLKNLINRCLVALPVATALASSLAMASVPPVSRESGLKAANAFLPFFVAAAHFDRNLLELPALASQEEAISNAAPGAQALRLVSLPATAISPEAPLSAAAYWKRFDGVAAPPLSRRTRPAPPARAEILGSVALAISNAPLSQRWRTALEERADSYFGSDCRAVAAACASKLRQQLSEAVGIAGQQEEQEAIRSINAVVNMRLKYRNDMDTYGVPDYWATASEVLQRGTGDCKGYAILKMWMLLAAGFDRSQLRLQLVKIPATGQDHAVLVVNTLNGQLVLDNIKPDVRNDFDVREYVPLLSFVDNATHIHGVKKAAKLS